MIVYCNVTDCRSYKDGQCHNKWPIGTEAIAIEQDEYGTISCSDFRYAEGKDPGPFEFKEEIEECQF